MEEKKGAKYFIRITVTLLLIAGIMAFALAAVNAVTEERIAENNAAEVNAVLAQIFGDGIDAKTVDADVQEPVREVYEIRSGSDLLGWALKCSPSGFKAEIDMIVGVNADGTCRAVKVVSLSETPGLGARVGEDKFLDQFSGKTADDNVEVKVNVDEVTGATISSRAVTEAVNAALKAASELGGAAE